MADARLTYPARWRALLRFLWKTGPRRVVGFWALVLALGLLPTAVILLTGALVRAVPAAAEQGLASPGGRGAVLALAALVLALAALSVGQRSLVQLCRVLDAAFALEIHRAVAGVTLGTPGIAPLEDPAFSDALQSVQDAERRGVLRSTVLETANVVMMRLRGAGAFAVLLGFRWWAPLVLAVAWHLTNRLYVAASEKGVTLAMTDGAVRMRRAEYMRSLALEAPAAKELRVFGLGHWVVGRYAEAWDEALGAMWSSRRANRGLTAATVAALAAAHAAVLAALAMAAWQGKVEVAAALVFAQAVIATSDLGVILDSQWFLAQSLAVAERAEALRAWFHGTPSAPRLPDPPASALSTTMTTGTDARETGMGERRTPKGVAVRLEGVRFAYPGRERPVLDGLELDIPAGQSLAIVGENGAGKSTLIKLLCGLYDPAAGRVTLDGVSPLEARGRMAVIFQDFVRYALPLRVNVAFGSLSLMHDPQALDGALRDAGGAALLDSLPQGWDTVLSREFEGGADLSGGQWQRVALARALAAVRGGAGLLILDEPTASLDVRAETELFDRFLELTKDVTTILVSHRLSSVRHADRIVVIHDGRVAEDGTHDALMRTGGRYAGMFSLQAERFARDPASLDAGAEVVDA